MFPITPASVERVLQLDGKRYFLATATEASQIQGVSRSWDVKRVPRQEGDPTQEFTIPLTSFHNGYGYTFSGESGVYEIANGWDLSAPGKAITYPRLTTAEGVNTAFNYRGWLYWNATTGYMYMLRGSYAIKYRPDDSISEWPVIERHYFGASIVVAGKPAEFQGKLYVPLVDISTPDAEVLARWHELDTISTTVTEVQAVTETGSPTGGTFTLSFNDGLTTTVTSGLAFDVSAADMQTALRLIPGLEGVTVSRSGTTTNFIWTITMTGAPSALGTTSPPALVRVDSTTGGTHAIAVTTTTAGTGDQWDRADANVEARTFTTWQKPTVGPVLVRANANKVSTCATTPTTAANWGTEQAVGDSGARINSLTTLGRLLFVGKEDGVWSFDETGQAINEIPAIAAIRDKQNCIGMSEYNGYLLVPHKLGLIRWRPGSSWGIVGAEQEGVFEGERSAGWGAVAGLAAYGKYCYQTINDLFNGIGVVGSLQAPGGPRGSLTPHMHQSFSAFVEDCAVAGITSQPTAGHVPATWSDSNAVGTISWTSPANAASTTLFASAAEGGTTHYLKGLNPNPAIPSGATIKGIRLEVDRLAVSPSSTTTTLSFTSTSQNYVVPTGVTAITVDLKGAQGGKFSGFTDGGKGGRTQTTLAVTPAETLTVYVGGQGHDGGIDGAGGFHGGGDGGDASTVPSQGGAGGGGHSEIKRGSTTLAVAGGGGGSFATAGGAGGGTTGGDGASIPGATAGAGAGGTQSAGGVGGAAGESSSQIAPNDGDAGASLAGGDGGDTTGGGGGAGGGGGYFGGGGGGSGRTPGPGGGGSSYSSGTNTVHTQGYQSGNGSITIVAPEATDIVDSTVKLVKAGSVVGDNKAKSGQWSMTATTAVYGSATDLWGTTWTAAQVNASDFGFVLSAVVTNGTAQLNNAKMYVFYEVSGVSDPGSFLAVITLDADRTTATPYIYKLPRAGMPAANDPFIAKANSDATFETARYFAPARNTQKEYRSVEFYPELSPENTSTVGFQMWAAVDDGAFFPLLDEVGATATIRFSGHQELFFPASATSIGRWVQLRPTLPAAAEGELPVAVTLRDITIHGAWLPKMTEEIQATLVLKEGGQFEDGYTDTRTVAQQLADLDALQDPRVTGAGPVSLRDPIKREEGRCVITGVTLKPVRFKERHEDTWIAIVSMRKALYA